jgi:hypothetical protein
MKPSDRQDRGLQSTHRTSGDSQLDRTPTPVGAGDRRSKAPLSVLGSAHALTIYGEKFRGLTPWRQTGSH